MRGQIKHSPRSVPSQSLSPLISPPATQENAVFIPRVTLSFTILEVEILDLRSKLGGIFDVLSAIMSPWHRFVQNNQHRSVGRSGDWNRDGT